MDTFLTYLNNIYFPIFPEGSLASSIITTVWIGIVVVVFFNLRYGWVLSGLVVPGYIVPLLLVKPIAVWVIGVESILVYFLVYSLNIIGLRLGLFAELFGRDRFFAILIISVLVRIIFDGWLLPELGSWYVSYTGEAFDYKNNLHSFGLIIIALIANMFWKPGVIKGLAPLVIIVTITYIITRFILMEHTNFTISNLSYIYEDFSSNISKSYIILITTAFIASRMNLRYGWDFNGILIPALLALQWYQPSKILISFVEALIIYALAILLLKLPFFKNINMEGGRKLLLFFNIGFIYKIGLSFVLIELFPQIQINDFFGFGYLLSTLIAVKMFDKNIIALFLRATIQTSFISIIFASIIGFSLVKISSYIEQTVVLVEPKEHKVKYITTNLETFLLQSKVELYENISSQRVELLTPKELAIFTDSIKGIKRSKTIKEAIKYASYTNDIGFDIFVVEHRYIILKESGKKGWGLFVFDIKSTSNLTIAIPRPLDELLTYESGIVLFSKMEAKNLVFGGSKKSTLSNDTKDILNNKYSFFYKLFEAYDKQDFLMLRGYTLQNAKKIFQKTYIKENFEKQKLSNSVFIHRTIPKDFKLNIIELVKGDENELNIIWNISPVKNIFNQTNHKSFVEIFLNKETKREILNKLIEVENLKVKKSVLKIDGFLQETILEQKEFIAPKGGEKYIKPSLYEILYFDNEVITPLVKFILENKTQDLWEKNNKQLNTIASVASLMNYSLIKYFNTQSNKYYILLLEKENNKKYRGSYIFKLGESIPYSVQIPRPLYEKNSFEFGVSLFERTNSLALFIGGSHPYSNKDKSSDLLRYSNKENFYNIVNQVFLRELKEQDNLNIICRAFGIDQFGNIPKENVILSFTKGYLDLSYLDTLSKYLYDFLKKDNLTIALSNGDKIYSRFKSVNTPQSLYTSQTINKNFTSIWLSNSLRSLYSQKDEYSYFIRAINSLGIKIEDTILAKYLQKNSNFSINNKIVKDFEIYLKTKDPILLLNINNKKRYNIEVILDKTTSIPLIILKDGENIIAFGKNSDIFYKPTKISKRSISNSKIEQWFFSKSSMLMVVE